MASKEITDERHLHWDEVRRRTPPDGLSREEWWAGLKFKRSEKYLRLPLQDKEGRAAAFVPTDKLSEFCHRIDLHAGGRIGAPAAILTEENRDRFFVSSLIQESISSSVLEGAATTRREAASMLRSGRKPRTVDERMILNNFQTMQWINNIAKEPLTTDAVMELHRRVTQDTLNPTDIGRFRSADEPVHVYDQDKDEVLFWPPPAESLPGRIRQMCDFANGHTPEGFLHPAVRAIVLHYWLAYDHPFVDGNGRAARALFYWCMLHYGYWLFQFVSISGILVKAKVPYARSYLLCQTDESDLTYFIHYQIDVIDRAFGKFEEYINEKTEELNRIQQMLDQSGGLNHRQFALLTHAVRHPGFWYTIKSHQTSHNVAYQTARTDLLSLAEAGLLLQRKRGKQFRFQSPPDLASRIENLAANITA